MWCVVLCSVGLSFSSGVCASLSWVVRSTLLFLVLHLCSPEKLVVKYFPPPACCSQSCTPSYSGFLKVQVLMLERAPNCFPYVFWLIGCSGSPLCVFLSVPCLIYRVPVRCVLHRTHQSTLASVVLHVLNDPVFLPSLSYLLTGGETEGCFRAVRRGFDGFHLPRQPQGRAWENVRQLAHRQNARGTFVLGPRKETEGRGGGRESKNRQSTLARWCSAKMLLPRQFFIGKQL